MEDLDFDDLKHEQISVEKLYDKVKFSLSIQFMNQAEASKKWMLLYTVITAVCYLMDGLIFISTFKRFSVKGDEHAELLLLMATLLNFSIDVYYFIWVLNLKQKLPPKMGSFVSDAILGYSKKMTRELYHNLEKKE